MRVKKIMDGQEGFTLIDVLISVAIIVLLFGGIYLIYFSIIDVINNIELRTAATSVVEGELEVIRNLDYTDVGTVGGVPTGAIAPSKSITFDNFDFSVSTTVRNIDDPFDGTLGGVPNDTAPADYKLIQMEIGCPDCAKFVPLVYTATVAPKNLESASQGGSIFINVFDAYAEPVGGASVHVVNSSVAPAIDLVDATNNNGVLQLVGVPTSTQSYEISVSLPGYAPEQTYDSGDLGGSAPVTPHVTVAAQTVTSISFVINKSSDISVEAKDVVCSPISGVDFRIDGTNLIGRDPDFLRFSTTSITSATSAIRFSEVPADTYSFVMNSSSLDILGTMPFTPIVVNPSSTIDFDFIVEPANPRSLLVAVKDGVTRGAIPGAAVTLASLPFSETKTTGRAFVGHTDWSSGAYDSKDGVDTDGFPGSLVLELNASSTYTTSTVSWLVSGTIDVGSNSSTFYTLNWLPTSQPPLTGLNSALFQLASNNDNTTWDFIGPDGTASSYYSSSGEAIHNSHSGDRYLRYKVFLRTADENTTPSIADLSVEFNGPCVPQGHVLFTNLALASDYILETAAAGYIQSTSTVDILGDWQQTEVLLTPQ